MQEDYCVPLRHLTVKTVRITAAIWILASAISGPQEELAVKLATPNTTCKDIPAAAHQITISAMYISPRGLLHKINLWRGSSMTH